MFVGEGPCLCRNGMIKRLACGTEDVEKEKYLHGVLDWCLRPAVLGASLGFVQFLPCPAVAAREFQRGVVCYTEQLMIWRVFCWTLHYIIQTPVALAAGWNLLRKGGWFPSAYVYRCNFKSCLHRVLFSPCRELPGVRHTSSPGGAVPGCLVPEAGLTQGGNHSRGRTRGGGTAAAQGGCGWAGGGCPPFGGGGAAVEDEVLCKLLVFILVGEGAGYPPQKWALLGVYQAILVSKWVIFLLTMCHVPAYVSRDDQMLQ